MPRLSHGGQLSQRHWWLDAGIIPRLVRGAKPQPNLAAPTPASSGDRPPAACDSQSRRGSISGSGAGGVHCRACPFTERRDAPLRFAAGTSFGRSARSRARCFRIDPTAGSSSPTAGTAGSTAACRWAWGLLASRWRWGCRCDCSTATLAPALPVPVGISGWDTETPHVVQTDSSTLHP